LSKTLCRLEGHGSLWLSNFHSTSALARQRYLLTSADLFQFWVLKWVPKKVRRVTEARLN
jgi:hypothetical protein